MRVIATEIAESSTVWRGPEQKKRKIKIKKEGAKTKSNYVSPSAAAGHYASHRSFHFHRQNVNVSVLLFFFLIIAILITLIKLYVYA